MKNLYYNGTVITMQDEKIMAEAVLEEDGVIFKTGSYESVRRAAQERGGEVTLHDLKGSTLMPAFIDAHSHFSGMAHSFLQADLSEAVSFEEIGEKLQEFIRRNQIPKGQWVVAGGYDHNQLQEKRHPNKDVLERYVPEHLVVLTHKSGHMGVLNQRAMEHFGIDEKTENLPGGFLEKKEGVPTGYMEENTFLHYLEKVPMPDAEDLLKAYAATQEKYASYGITTIQEGMLPRQLLPFYQALLSENLLKLDVVGYAGTEDMEAVRGAFPEAVQAYDRNFKLGGYKIFLDGSPQGRTAWMKEPYENSPEGNCGYPTMTDEAVREAVERAAAEGMQILAHCNGDAAAEQYIRAVKEVKKRCPGVEAIRPVMIHAQFLPPDKMEELSGIIPSFFAAHVYHWGDVHLENLGRKRAERMSPAASAMRQKIPFTFHQDAPVIEPDMLETVWCACSRVSRNGEILGEEQKIPVYEALKAVTIHAAYQYGEERQKGSIEPGKRADFVILNRNPLACPIGELRTIRVLETIRQGKTVYSGQDG